MSYPDRQEIRQVRFVSMRAVFWGVVLIAIGVAALLPDSLSRYVWPAVAIGAGVWLLFAQWEWHRAQPRNSYQPADRI